MNQNVPFVWRKNYQNEVGSNEELLETAHEKARQYLSRAAEAATRSTTYTMPLLQREIGHAKDVAQVGVGRLIRGQATAVAHPECPSANRREQRLRGGDCGIDEAQSR